MLAQYVLEIALDGNICELLDSCGQIQPLIGPVQVAIGQQQRVSVIGVGSEIAVVPCEPQACRADRQRAGHDGNRLGSNPCAEHAERARADQRGINPDWDVGKFGLKLGPIASLVNDRCIWASK